MADGNKRRFDGTLAAIMWVDALLSAALALVAVVVSPLVATIGLPDRYLSIIAGAVIGLAVLLAACGASTAVLIVLRLRRGRDLLPAELRLPLPEFMLPSLGGQPTPAWRQVQRPVGAAARSPHRG